MAWCRGDPRVRPVLPGGREQGRPVRRVVLHRRALHRDLLPAELPGPARRAAATSSSSRPRPPPSGRGYRACKRCRPDASPGSPEWDPRADVVGRAMRLIADGVVDREGVRRPGPAAQLQRAPPAPAARRRARRRAARARPGAARADRPAAHRDDGPAASPRSRSPPASRASASSTTRSERSSPRRPRELRAAAAARGDRARRSITRAAAAPRAVRRRRGVAFLAARAVPGVETVDARRTDARCGSRTDRRGVTLAPAPTATWPAPSGSTTCAISPRRWPGRGGSSTSTPTRSRSCDALGPGPVLAPLVARRPGLRVPGQPDGVEQLVRAVRGPAGVGGRGPHAAGRLVERFGEAARCARRRPHAAVPRRRDARRGRSGGPADARRSRARGLDRRGARGRRRRPRDRPGRRPRRDCGRGCSRCLASARGRSST